MKIRIKVKMLILIGFIFLLTIIWGIPNAMLMIAKSVETEKATFFYEKYATYPMTSNIKGKYLYANSLIDFNNKYTIYFNGWGGGDNVNPEHMIKAKEILQDTMKNTPRNETERRYYIDSYKMLLDVAIGTGDVEILREWIEFGQENGDEKLTYIADIYNGFLLRVNGDRNEAQAIVDQYEGTDFHDVNLDILKAEILVFQGNYDEAKKIYENLSERHWPQDSFGSIGYGHREFWINHEMKDFEGDHVIKGTVTCEGKPMPFVEIYVQPADNGISIGGESYIGITNENGEYETLGLKDGVYNIGIGVDGSLLEGKVLQGLEHDILELNGRDGEINFEFKNTLQLNMPKKISENEFTVSWEAVEEADYYTVAIVSFGEESGSVFYSPVIDENGKHKLNQTSTTIHTDLQRAEMSGYGLGMDGLITSDAILGLFLPGVPHPVIVNAYDEEDILLTRSLPLITYYDEIPSIAVEGSPTEGEEMILKQDYLEAIEYYENILKSNPDDIDALIYLTKIYGIGWKNGEKNIERAVVLGNRLKAIVGNDRLLNNIIQDLEINEIKRNKDLYYTTVEDKKEEEGDYNYHLSRYYIATEDWIAARDTLENIGETYIPDNLFYLNMYLGDYDKALENTKYLYGPMSIHAETDEALKKLIRHPPSDDDKETFNRFLLELVTDVPRDEGKALYDEIVKEISNRNLKFILRSIYLERGWDISEPS